MMQETGDDLEWLRSAYLAIARTAASVFKKRKVDRFEIYLSKFPEEEDRMEKMVMGSGYDAIAQGKLHWACRAPLDPHVKYKDLEDNWKEFKATQCKD